MTLKKFRSIGLFIAMLLLSSVILLACSKGDNKNNIEPKPPIGITISTAGDAESLKIGETLQLTAKVSPSSAKQTVTWSISNTTRDGEFASIDKNGLVTGEAEGSVTITATSTEDDKISDSITLTVTADDDTDTEEPEEPEEPGPEEPGPEEPKAPTKITVTSSEGETSITVGDTLQMIATVEPEGAESTVKWSSSDKSKATIDEASGMLKGVASGNVTVTATSTVDTSKKGTLSITIEAQSEPEPTEPEEPTSITVTSAEGEDTLAIDETLQLTATVQPEGADQAVTWKSEDEDIATVSKDGLVKGVSEGEVTITATSKVDDTINGTITLTVEESTDTEEPEEPEEPGEGPDTEEPGEGPDTEEPGEPGEGPDTENPDTEEPEEPAPDVTYDVVLSSEDDKTILEIGDTLQLSVEITTIESRGVKSQGANKILSKKISSSQVSDKKLSKDASYTKSQDTSKSTTKSQSDNKKLSKDELATKSQVSDKKLSKDASSKSKVMGLGLGLLKSEDAVVTYESHTTDVATVDGDGLLTAQGAGNAVISATVEISGKTYHSDIIIVVAKDAEQASVLEYIQKWTPTLAEWGAYKNSEISKFTDADFVAFFSKYEELMDVTNAFEIADETTKSDLDTFVQTINATKILDGMIAHIDDENISSLYQNMNFIKDIKTLLSSVDQGQYTVDSNYSSVVLSKAIEYVGTLYETALTGINDDGKLDEETYTQLSSAVSSVLDGFLKFSNATNNVVLKPDSLSQMVYDYSTKIAFGDVSNSIEIINDYTEQADELINIISLLKPEGDNKIVA